MSLEKNLTACPKHPNKKQDTPPPLNPIAAGGGVNLTPPL